MPGRTKRNSFTVGEHVVFEYIRCNDITKLKKCLSKEGLLADTYDTGGHTPMTCACVEGNEQAVELFIQYNHNVNQKDNNGNCPVHYAAGLGKENILKMLLNHDADINIKGKNANTALHCAIQEKRVTIVKLLLDVGIDIPVKRSSICINPFQLAIEVGSQAIHDMLEQAMKLRENPRSHSHLLRRPNRSTILDDQRHNNSNTLISLQNELQTHKVQTESQIQNLQHQVQEMNGRFDIHDNALSRIEKILETTTLTLLANKHMEDRKPVGPPTDGYIQPNIPQNGMYKRQTVTCAQRRVSYGQNVKPDRQLRKQEEYIDPEVTDVTPKKQELPVYQSNTHNNCVNKLEAATYTDDSYIYGQIGMNHRDLGGTQGYIEPEVTDVTFNKQELYQSNTQKSGVNKQEAAIGTQNPPMYGQKVTNHRYLGRTQGYIEPEVTDIAVDEKGKQQCNPCARYNTNLPSSYISPAAPPYFAPVLDLREDYASQQETRRKTSYAEGRQSEEIRYTKEVAQLTRRIRPASEPCISPGYLESIPLKKEKADNTTYVPRENHYSVIDDKGPDCLLSGAEKSSIQKNFIKLKQRVDFEKIKDQLFEEDILTADDIITWSERSPSDRAVFVLLEKIYKGPRKHKTALQNILCEEGLHDVADLLT